MAQTTTPTTPSAGMRGEVVRRLRQLVAGTPGTMRLVGASAALGAVLFGVLGFVAVNLETSSLRQSRADAAQLVRLQRIHTSLVQADASATNAFLVGGLEPRESRVSYEEGIARASATIADAAAHDPTHASDLGRVNDALSRYTGLVESARANNRQGFPVGVAYVRQASGLLHEEMLPRLVGLVDQGQGRVADAYGRGSTAPAGLWIGALLALAAALGASGWLATKTRRVLNVPLATAALVVAVTFVVGALLLGAAQRKAGDVRDGAYRSAVSVASARIAAFDAKSAESLTLIARGSGQAFEERFVAQTSTALSQLSRVDDPSILETMQGYLTAHSHVAELAAAGKYDEAVAVATGPVSAAGSSNAAFRAFDEASDRALTASSATIARDLDDARAPLEVLRWIVLAAAALAAAAAWQGLALRLREYR